MTIISRCYRVARRTPGKTASEIANILRMPWRIYGYGPVSSALYRLVQRGRLHRRKGPSCRYKTGAFTEAWRYYP